MNKSDDRRADIVDKLADYVLANGLSASSLRPLADAAGTSDRMLLYYFKDKSELMSAALERVAQRLGGHLEAQLSGKRLAPEALRKKVMKIVMAPDVWPFMRVWLEIAAQAAGNDALYRTIGGQIARGFIAFTEARLDVAAPARKREALRLLASLEGAVLLKSLGIEEIARL